MTTASCGATPPSGTKFHLSIAAGELRGSVDGVDPKIFSPAGLGLPINRNTSVRVILENGTAATYGQLYFITDEDRQWDERKHIDFWLYPEAAGVKTYDLDLFDNALWKGTLHQFRLDPEQGAASGTFAVQTIQLLQARDTA